MAKFGEILRKERKKVGKTLGEVAEVAGVKISYLSDVELSRRNPLKTPQIIKVAEMLGCDAQPLILAAAKQRGGVTISTGDKQLNNVAVSLARSGERLGPERLAEIQRIISEAEED